MPFDEIDKRRTERMSLTIGVDVGGTKIAAGAVTPDGEVVERLRRQTPDDVAGVDSTIVDVVRDLTQRHEVKAVGIGAAGWISADRATVIFAPNLDWRDTALRDLVERQIGIPVIVENDANAAAWGEFRFGAGADADDLLLVTVGTGVGGGVVVDGQLMRGAFGVAGEIGHFRVVPGGHECGCGRFGCFEQYASGTALVRAARERAPADPAAGPLLEVAGGEPDKITGPMITRLANSGDPMCIDLLGDLGTWLGEGIASLAAILDPGVVALGGGVSEAGELLMGRAERAFEAALPGSEYRPHLQMRLATLGNEAGLIGAADLARDVRR